MKLMIYMMHRLFCLHVAEGDYDRALHIGSIFILMATSCLGVVLPLILNQLKDHVATNIVPTLLNWAKMFGAGVILCTGFVHMLVPAIEV